MPLILFILAVASVGKICGAGLGAWMGGMSRRNALAVGFGMNARGMMEIILASIALEFSLIDQRIFVALIVMAIITSMISGPIMQKLITNSPIVVNFYERRKAPYYKQSVVDVFPVSCFWFLRVLSRSISNRIIWAGSVQPIIF